MNNSGDVAEQIVRLSLEGFTVTAKLTGTAAKHLAVLLVSVLKQEQKTRGKARLTSMIRSGKELKVFAVPNKDLQKFVEHAKQYGVLYCVLKDKENQNPNAVVDIIARAEDAAKIQRIFDRFGIGKVERASVVNSNLEKEQDAKPQEMEAPSPFAKTQGKDPPLEKNSMPVDMPSDKKTSVREKLKTYKAKAAARYEPINRGTEYLLDPTKSKVIYLPGKDVTTHESR